MKNNWYSKAKFANDERVVCPNCYEKYPWGPLFDHHFSQCPNCKIKVVEFALLRVVYIVDYEKSPEIFKNLIMYLHKYTETEAETMVEDLLEFFS